MKILIPFAVAYLYFGFDRALADGSDDLVDKPPYARTLPGLIGASLLWPLVTLAVLAEHLRFRKFPRALAILVLQVIWFLTVFIAVTLIYGAIGLIVIGWRQFVLMVAFLVPLHYVLLFIRSTLITFIAAILTSPKAFFTGLVLYYGQTSRLIWHYRKAFEASGELRFNRWNKHERDLSNIFKTSSFLEHLKSLIFKVIMVAESATTVPAYLGVFETERQRGCCEEDAIAVANRIVRFTRFLVAGGS